MQDKRGCDVVTDGRGREGVGGSISTCTLLQDRVSPNACLFTGFEISGQRGGMLNEDKEL